MTSTPQIHIDRSNPRLWTATFDHPPINLIDPDTIEELDTLIDALETDPDVRVIVFKSADPEFFLAHFDVLGDSDRAFGMKMGKTGMHPWLDVLARLSRAPVISVAAIRGRARGAGSEFVLACDLRFASAEKAILGQPEIGVSAVPGANPMVRLAELMGRGRSLEVVLGGDDFPGALAERYGYVNRAIPDGEFESFVDSFARRIASFDKATLAEIKTFVDAVTLPADSVFPPALDAFIRGVSSPDSAVRLTALVEKGMQQRGDVEMRFGHYIVQHDLG